MKTVSDSEVEQDPSVSAVEKEFTQQDARKARRKFVHSPFLGEFMPLYVGAATDNNIELTRQS